jgi:CRP-like cAMP-binding protein
VNVQTESAAILQDDLKDLRPFLRDFEPPLGYPRGTELVPQGVGPRSVFLIASGLVKLIRRTPEGHDAIVGLRPRGWFIGSEAAILDEPYAATVSTVTRCEAYRITTGTFRNLIRKPGPFSWRLHRLEAMGIRQGFRDVEALAVHSARSRLNELLERLCLEVVLTDQGWEVPLRDWEMAQLIAVSPQYMSKLVHELIDEGVLRREGTTLFVVGLDHGPAGDAE